MVLLHPNSYTMCSFFSDGDSRPSTSNVTIPSLPCTIQYIYSLHKEGSTDKQICEILMANTLFASCSLKSLQCKVKSTLDSLKKCIRGCGKNSSKVADMLAKDFNPPQSRLSLTVQHTVDTANVTSLVHTNATLMKETRGLKRKIGEVENDLNAVRTQANAFAEARMESEEQLKKMKIEYEAVEQELKKTQGKHQQVKLKNEKLVKDIAKSKNKLRKSLPSRRKQQRKENSIAKMQKVIRSQKLQISQKKSENEQLWQIVIDYQEKEFSDQKSEEKFILLNNETGKNDSLIKELESKLEMEKKRKVDAQKRASSLKKRMETDRSKVAEQMDMSLESQVEVEVQNEELSNRIRNLEKANILLEKKQYSTFDSDGHYSEEVRGCCITLITENNVSMRQVPAVIHTVMTSLTGCEPKPLPSLAYLSSTIMPQAKIIALKHAATSMIEGLPQSATDPGNVLHQDATSKFHDHFEGMQVTLNSGKTMSIGLKQVAGSDANTYLQAFEETITDLAKVISSDATEASLNKSKLIVSIKNMMSDQCAVNGVFNAGVKQIREELLPQVIKNYKQLSQEEQKDLADVGMFACRMHLLANLHQPAENALRQFDDCVVEGNNPYALRGEESSTLRLIRTSCSAFTKRGSQAAGAPVLWESFLRGRNRKNNFTTFHGHRFNISLKNAAALYFHLGDISQFLDDHSMENDLFKSIRFDYTEKVCQAGSRAMGIVYALVTQPLEHLVNQEGSILDLNADLKQLQDGLSLWSEDASSALDGTSMLTRIPKLENEVICNLFRETDDAQLDSLTVLALQLIASQMLIVLERQAASQLPGGSLWDLPTSAIEKAATVPRSNIVSERDMAILDNLLRQKPNLSPSNLETMVLCLNNKPSKWLASLSNQERAKVLLDAKTRVPEFRELMRNRQESLKEKLTMKLKDKKDKKEKKQEKEVASKLNLTHDIDMHGGLWKLHEVDDRVTDISNTKTQRRAILSQLRFHRVVIGAKGPRELFQEKVKSIAYSTEQLINNLKEVLQTNEQGVPAMKVPGYTYRPLQDVTSNVAQKRNESLVKRDHGRRQNQVKQQKLKLPTYICEPRSLVGKKILHKCVDKIDDETVVGWYKGDVLDINQAHDDPFKIKYKVVYDVEEEGLEWSFNLLMDIKKGDLIVLDTLNTK